jgi:3-carboxy-cis,cis-muconate cycloisomerase
LDLAEPVAPWHALRGRIAELAAALDLASGSVAKIALDLALLAQTEVGEASERDSGGSSAMPQKRNPIASVLAVACARRVHALAEGLTGGLPQEHERAAGAWHAEWEPLREALGLMGGAAVHVRKALTELEVDPERMRANIDESTLSERAVVEFGLDRDSLAEVPLRTALSDRLPPEGLARALDPAEYLGAAGAFVDRALAYYRSET